MSFQAILLNNQIESKSFHNISNLSDIYILSTQDVAPVEVNFLSGEIKINNKIATRLAPYFCSHAKPIQYRKVVEDIGLIDCEAMYEEAILNAPDKVYLFEEFLKNPTQANREALKSYCSERLQQVPTQKYEEQTLGYEYTQNNTKTKIEIISNLEVKSVTAHVTITDLVTKQKTDSYMRLA